MQVPKENTEIIKESTLEYLNTKKAEIFKIIDKYIEQLGNPEKIERSSIRQLATAFGFLVDKCILVESANKDGNDKLEKLIEAIKNS